MRKIFAKPLFVPGFFLVLFFISSLILLSNRIFSADLPSCTSVVSPNNPNPNGLLASVSNSVNCTPVACSSLATASANTIDDVKAGANCYYSPLGSPLPPCKLISGEKKPRINCADLTDLPLCSSFDPANVASGVNCVQEAKEIVDPNASANPRKIRGVDYAVNNIDSVRFCGQVESCAAGEVCNLNIMNSQSNCVRPKCHQMTASGPAPNDGTNCDILACNFLSLEELKVSDNRFEDASRKYCDGSAVKCYNFFNNTVSNPNNSSNLQYIKYRPDNTMCQIHNCRPDSELCGADDTQNILNKDAAYQADYIQYINGSMPIESGLCQQLSCFPVTSRTHRCLPMENLVPNDLNGNCDRCIKCAQDEACPAANGCAVGYKAQSCQEGYCTQIIDCNLRANASEPECVVSTPDSPDTDTDLFDAWFYRPTPPSRVLNSSGLIDSQIAEKITAPDDDTNQPKYCYYYRDVESLGWLRNVAGIRWHTLSMPTRSPQLCTGPRYGDRGYGYGYLCGTSGNSFRNPRSDVGYIKGVASVNYESQDPEYKIKACLRYVNSGRLEVCGKRECRFSISKSAFGSSQSQWCGFDICKEMRIFQSDIDRCSMSKHTELFDTNETPSCVSGRIDGFVRMRARKYGRKICVFVDQKGAVAYDNKNFDGKEKLSDGTCVDGNPDLNGDCDGKDTNDDKALASVWRTVKMIDYIGNSLSGTQRAGYVDADGRFFAQQDCAKIPLRVGPPRFYGVATISNSRNLFEPPLYIINARTARGGQVSDPLPGEQYGFTDFYQPEILVGYGSTQQKMSLGAGFVGKDLVPEDYPISPSHKIISSDNGAGNTPYSADIFIKKEYDEGLNQPILCLYRNVNDANGIPVDPIKISCVKRKKPEISSIFNDRMQMAFSIVPDAANIFNNAKFKMRLVSDYGANNLNNNCGGDDICSKEVVFEKQATETHSCFEDIEEYKICSSRSYCSQLVWECAENEIALHNAIVAGETTAELDAFKERCNTTLLRDCNQKLGIVNSSAADFFGQIDTSLTALNNIDPNYQNFQSLLNASARSAINPSYANAYGWFNEVCIVKGFEDKLKNVLAYNTVDGVMGKCIIDVNKSLYSPSVCNVGGGKAPYCVCLEVFDGFVPPNGQEIRLQTPREAGLCVDIPLPKFCPAIDYTVSNSSDPNDPDFTISSVNNSIARNIFGPNYSDLSGVHTSHKLRTEAISANHAEYNSILGGTSTVYGVCKGFWKSQTDSSGITLKPTLNCRIDGTWERPSVSNSCIRYTCPAITTSGIQEGSPENNSYQNDYALGETGDNRGARNGFATWPSKQKSADNDFLENVSTNSCITGYQLKKDSNGNNILPTRACAQTGSWGAVSDSCVRIRCPIVAVGGLLPRNRTTQTEISTWSFYGGAEFLQGGLASRSDAFIPAESRVAGVCRNDMGFFSSANPPTMDCNYQGVWENLQNPCIRLGCSQVTATSDVPSTTTGFAYWDAVQLTSDQPITATATSCAAGYFKNPYKPMPTRQCESRFLDNARISKWSDSVTNPCINKCPGADMDATIGIGRTTEVFSGGAINISWPSITPVAGAIAANSYAYTNDNCANMNAGTFTQGRINGCYRLRRLCGNGTTRDIDGRLLARGEWGKVEPMCVANNGLNGNANYSADSNPATTGSADSVAVNGSLLTATSCAADFWKANRDSSAMPVRQCVYLDASKKIDQVYFGLVNNTQDCERITCPNINNANGILWNINSNNNTSRSTITGSCDSINNFFLYGAAPTMTCQNNGNWSNIANPNNCSKQCFVPSLTRRTAPKENGKGILWTLDFAPIKAGDQINFSVFARESSSDRDCHYWSYRAICDANGNLSVLEIGHTGNGDDINNAGGCSAMQIGGGRVDFPQSQDPVIRISNDSEMVMVNWYNTHSITPIPGRNYRVIAKKWDNPSINRPFNAPNQGAVLQR